MTTPLSTYLSRSISLLAIVTSVSIATSEVHAQGCVAIKQMGGSAHDFDEIESAANKWDLSVAYQHFRSHRHFVGTNQQFQRYALGSEVINNVDQVDTTINYKIIPSTSVTFDIPYFSAS